MAPRVIVFVLFVVGLFPAISGAETWRRLRSDNFVFVGDAPEGRVRIIARELEEFRAVMTTVLPGAASESPVPTVVVVFSSRSALRPYQPQFRGRPIELDGFFLPGEDVNYLAVSADRGSSAVRTVLHEYIHFLVGNTLGPLPTWLQEGLAEFYETTTEIRDGRGVIIGSAPRQHLRVLQESKLIPLRELMAVGRNSPLYNEGSRRGVFYAEAWALTHYLAVGNPQFRSAFSRYLGLVRQAGASDQTFTTVFGVSPADMEGMLEDYIQNASFPSVEVTLPSRVDSRISGRTEVISEPDAFGYLGDMVARLGRADDARELLEKAVAADANAPRAVAALGLIELRRSRADEAIRLLEKAAAMAPDEPIFAAALGSALVSKVTQQRDRQARNETLERAHVALERAVTLDPFTAQTSALLGYVEMSLNRNLPQAVARLNRATVLAPARENYRLMLANALTLNGDYDDAARHLEQLVARGTTDRVRASARQMLTRVAGLRTRAAPASSRVAGAPFAPAPVMTMAFTGLADPSASVDASRAVDGAAPLLGLRAVGVGESRVLGTFTAVACDGRQPSLIVNLDGGDRQFRSARLSDVDFVSFRDDTPESIGCGPQAKPFRALVTYRPQPGARGADGSALAVEFVPDEFRLSAP